MVVVVVEEEETHDPVTGTAPNVELLEFLLVNQLVSSVELINQVNSFTLIVFSIEKLI